MAEKTLYIIDAHAHIYASYYAIRALSSPAGEPTNAVYGFVSTVLALLRDRQPDGLVVVFDPPGPVFRSELYPDYKATREKSPEDLPGQIGRIHELVAAMGLREMTVENFEADDVIATLARRAVAEAGFDRVLICSKDKDLEQLIDERIALFDAAKGRVIDAAALLADKGYSPEMAVEVQTLTGDSTDNVPGVPGVGPKTAAKLLAEFKTVDNLLAHLDQVTGKVAERIRDHRDAIALTRKLVTLRDDVPLGADLGDLAPGRPNRGRLAALFDELGFKRFAEQMNVSAGGDGESAGAAEPEVAGDCDYRCVESADELAKLAGELARCERFALDTETTGLDPMRCELVGLSFAWEPKRGVYVPVQSPGGGGAGLPLTQVVETLGPVLADERIAKVGHHLKFDFQVLRQAGMAPANLAFDTMIASYLLDPERTDHKLDTLAAAELGHRTIPITDLIGKGRDQISMRDVPLDRIAPYAAEDADVTWRLAERLAPRLAEAGLDKLLADLEMPLVAVLADMEADGVALDTDLLARLSAQMESQAETLKGRIHGLVGWPFNIDSTKQLADVLFGEGGLGLTPVKRTKTGFSTDVEVLEQLAGQHEVPALVLEYRQLVKLKSTYADALPRLVNPATGRVHPSFTQTRAATGRLACQDPNLQNIPIRTEIGRQIRRAFVPGSADKVMLTADYSQIELRMLAHFSRDPALIAAFEADQDIHSFVASEVFAVPIGEVSPEQRRRAKAVNFGIIYGQTPFGLAKALGIAQSEAADFIDAYYKRYGTIRDFMTQCHEQAREQGYVTTILGRRRAIPEIDSRNKMRRALAERTAVNTVTQGSSADLIKRAMINIHARLRGGETKMLIQVHDELVFELPSAEVEPQAEMIRSEMAGAMKLAVPLKVDVAWGKSWLEAK